MDDYKCTANWLFFPIFSILLKNGGKKKGENNSKKSLKSFCCSPKKPLYK